MVFRYAIYQVLFVRNSTVSVVLEVLLIAGDYFIYRYEIKEIELHIIKNNRNVLSYSNFTVSRTLFSDSLDFSFQIVIYI